MFTANLHYAMDVLSSDIGIGHTLTVPSAGSTSTSAEDAALIFHHAGDKGSQVHADCPLNKVSNCVSRLAL